MTLLRSDGSQQFGTQFDFQQTLATFALFMAGGRNLDPDRFGKVEQTHLRIRRARNAVDCDRGSGCCCGHEAAVLLVSVSSCVSESSRLKSSTALDASAA